MTLVRYNPYKNYRTLEEEFDNIVDHFFGRQDRSIIVSAPKADIHEEQDKYQINLEMAGLKKEDIDGLICYRYFPPAPNELEVTSYLVAQQLGISPIALSHEATCARGQLLHALSWLEAGLCKYIVFAYADNSISASTSFLEKMPANNNYAVFGHFEPAGGYVMAAQRAMYELNTGPDSGKLSYRYRSR